MIANSTEPNRFSIIVPVYGTEEYLQECIDSVLRQTYELFELILVDDGSPDQCPKICDEYARADPRVHVIHKENGGVSSARNAGLEIAKGEYVWFVDSDDYVDEDSLLGLNNQLTENQAVLFAFQTDGMEGPFYGDLEDYLRNVYFPYKVNFTTWNKIYRLSFLKEHQIRFDEGEVIGEDLLFNLDCYAALFAQKHAILFDNRHCYHYRVRDGSAMQTMRDDALTLQLRLFRKTYGLLKNSVKEEILDQFYLQYLIAGIRQSRKLSAKQFAAIIREDVISQRKVSHIAKENFLKAEKASLTGRMRIDLFIAFMRQNRYENAGKIMGLR